MSYVNFYETLASAKAEAQVRSAQADRIETRKRFESASAFEVRNLEALALSNKAMDLDFFGPKAEASKAWTAFRRASKRAEAIRPEWMK
jgi:hypothetical protein